MRSYKCLTVNNFKNGSYSLVPIRDKDKFEIMKWRNEQIDILRQKELLTKEIQKNYFKTVVNELFHQQQPEQLLWSFFENDKLIGYGGLVHIDWKVKHGEISFITETSRNSSSDVFISDWYNFLEIIKNIASEYLNFSSIYTYAYDIRPLLYVALLKQNFKEIKRIPNSIEIKNQLKDIVIHEYQFNELLMRMAERSDLDIYYKWVNEAHVRINSFNSSIIDYSQHCSWFEQKIKSKTNFYIFFIKKNIPVGQVRIEKSNNENIIDISVDLIFRGKGYALIMLKKAITDFFEKSPGEEIYAYVKEDNVASIKLFLKANFNKINDADIKNCIKLKKNNVKI